MINCDCHPSYHVIDHREDTYVCSFCGLVGSERPSLNRLPRLPPREPPRVDFKGSKEGLLLYSLANACDVNHLPDDTLRKGKAALRGILQKCKHEEIPLLTAFALYEATGFDASDICRMTRWKGRDSALTKLLGRFSSVRARCAQSKLESVFQSYWSDELTYADLLNMKARLSRVEENQESEVYTSRMLASAIFALYVEERGYKIQQTRIQRSFNVSPRTLREGKAWLRSIKTLEDSAPPLSPPWHPAAMKSGVPLRRKN